MLKGDLLMKTKVQVSRRALTQRLNRKLAEKGLVLKLTKGKNAKLTVGDYYVVHAERGEVIQTKVNLEEFARKHEALAPWEELC